jgi:hypothetical protein
MKREKERRTGEMPPTHTHTHTHTILSLSHYSHTRREMYDTQRESYLANIGSTNHRHRQPSRMFRQGGRIQNIIGVDHRKRSRGHRDWLDRIVEPLLQLLFLFAIGEERRGEESRRRERRAWVRKWTNTQQDLGK